MPEDKNRQFLDFEKPIKELFDEIEKLQQSAEKTKIDSTDLIKKYKDQVIEKRREITQQPQQLAKGAIEQASRQALYLEVYPEDDHQFCGAAWRPECKR